MGNEDHPVRILAPRSTAQRVSRRAFLGGSAVAVFSSSVLLAACGSDSTSSSGTSPTGSSGGASPVLEDQLHFYNWAAYDDPKLMKEFTAEFGPATTVDVYNSMEEAIAKLVAAAGTSGYDVICPTGIYIPQMSQLDLLEELDLSRIPNFANIDVAFTNQSWDPNNQYTVCKDWGSTGWIYDTEVIKRDILTWNDFIDVSMNEASGNVSVLDTPTEGLPEIYFFANGIDWTTEDPAELDAFEAWAVDEMSPHIKGFNSYPGIQLTQGDYALSQAWNGDARQGLISAKDPSRYKWGLGAPETELWMDNWAILKGGPNPEAAYAWINHILDPEISLRDLEYHGYNTGIKGVQDAAEAAGLPFLDLVFFDEAQVATFRPGAVNSAQQRLVEIFDKCKAAAGA
jgi:spermidine/putrescine transport system substrate-binding protein